MFAKSGSAWDNLPRPTAMLIPHPYTLIPVSLLCSLAGDQTLPAIPHAWLFAPVRSSMASWVGGHVPTGGGEQVGGHTLPALHWYRHSRVPWYCQDSLQRGRTGMWMQPIPLLLGFKLVLKGVSALCPSFCPPQLLFWDVRTPQRSLYINGNRFHAQAECCMPSDIAFPEE